MHSFSAQESGQRPLDSETISGIKIAVLLTLTIVVLSSYLCLIIINRSTKKKLQGWQDQKVQKQEWWDSNKQDALYNLLSSQQDFYEKVCRDTLW